MQNSRKFLSALDIEALADCDKVVKVLGIGCHGKKERESIMLLKYYFVACLVGLGVTTASTTEQGLWELYGLGGFEVIENYPQDGFV